MVRGVKSTLFADTVSEEFLPMARDRALHFKSTNGDPSLLVWYTCLEMGLCISSSEKRRPFPAESLNVFRNGDRHFKSPQVLQRSFAVRGYTSKPLFVDLMHISSDETFHFKCTHQKPPANWSTCSEMELCILVLHIWTFIRWSEAHVMRWSRALQV